MKKIYLKIKAKTNKIKMIIGNIIKRRTYNEMVSESGDIINQKPSVYKGKKKLKKFENSEISNI